MIIGANLHPKKSLTFYGKRSFRANNERCISNRSGWMGSGYKVEKGVQWARLEPYQRALIAFLSGIKNEAWIRQRSSRAINVPARHSRFADWSNDGDVGGYRIGDGGGGARGTGLAGEWIATWNKSTGLQMACIRDGIVLNGCQTPGIYPVLLRDKRH